MFCIGGRMEKGQEMPKIGGYKRCIEVSIIVGVGIARCRDEGRT